jgi:valyl-tRNA synthetase
MEKSYIPSLVEKDTYEWWEKNGYFLPQNKSNETFVIPFPPPNITGDLHIGHALTIAIEDTIVRWHRMKGHNTLFLPGIDHAGIATQVTVEKKLKKETGQSRHDIGREQFIKNVWEYKKLKHCNIQNQIKQLGTSVDWSREKFTLDEECCEAVKEAFIRLYDEGLIYREHRLVNWCCELQSTVSDEEVEKKEVLPKEKFTIPGYNKKVQMGIMYYFAYQIEEFSDEEIIVATTRPETIIGDVAVCVNSKDERYTKYHGCHLICPFRNETIPLLIDDELVDINFGTGAVKVTPAHDYNDFDVGKRHNLPILNIFDQKGYVLTDGEFKGMYRFECRDKLVLALEHKGLLRKKESYSNFVGCCHRTGDIIEPMLMKQWFCNCEQMAQKAMNAVSTGELKLIPDSYNNVWMHWLKNIRPWCISRQLWWGHRIPAYICTLNENYLGEGVDESIVVARSEEEAKNKIIEKFKLDSEQIKSLKLGQDSDVLDTWFSSGLWNFSIMGWPNQTDDFKNFFPNTLLETGNDILFFWVARMVMLSLQLHNKLPFKDVYLHGLIRDKNGEKMAKMKGNVIDPLDIIHGCTLEYLQEKTKNSLLSETDMKMALKNQKKYFPKGIPECGSDALRYGLLAYTASNRDINFDIEHIVGCRKFCNKIWNAVKYVLYQLDNNFQPSPIQISREENQTTIERDSFIIIDKLNNVIKNCDNYFENYNLSAVTIELRQFLWHDFCDKFLEQTKSIMKNDQDHQIKYQTKNIMLHIIETYLRLLHPLMPYLTEKLWQLLPKNGLRKEDSIMIAEYPEYITVVGV